MGWVLLLRYRVKQSEFHFRGIKCPIFLASGKFVKTAILLLNISNKYPTINFKYHLEANSLWIKNKTNYLTIFYSINTYPGTYDVLYKNGVGLNDFRHSF